MNKRAKTELFRLQLQDELPAIGSGHRWVFVREGRKWVFILCPFTVTTTKVRVGVWRGLKHGPPLIRSPYIIKHMKRTLVLLGRSPTAFEKSALETEGTSDG